MRWEKRGLVFQPDTGREWSRSHAQVPTVDVIDEKTWRVFFASRDAENRSRISFVDVEAGRPEKIVHAHDRPLLELGRLGTFDDSGMMPSWITEREGRKYLYYIGWNIRGTVPYHNAIGLAISDDGGRTYRRLSEGPILDRTAREPYFCGTSCVLVDGDTWKNWYLSCTRWEIVDGRPEPFYHLKYAESRDGIDWERAGTVAIDYKDATEGGLAKASVVKERGGYRMWLSYRPASGYRAGGAKGYRIGYAESPDGISWRRDDSLAGIDVSPNGWDSEMIAYPHVVAWRGKYFMFYNGNGFGKAGFGYAVSG